MALLVAQLTNNWTIVPTAVFVGAMSGPFAFAIWVTDRTRVGRSVAPDVLFTTWLVGGGIAIVFAGIFESDFFYKPNGWGFLWIGLVEESAKVIAPLAICTLVPKYRSVAQALAFAIVTAGGFAVFESMTYALSALDESVRARAPRAVRAQPHHPVRSPAVDRDRRCRRRDGMAGRWADQADTEGAVGSRGRDRPPHDVEHRPRRRRTATAPTSRSDRRADGQSGTVSPMTPALAEVGELVGGQAEEVAEDLVVVLAEQRRRAAVHRAGRRRAGGTGT